MMEEQKMQTFILARPDPEVRKKMFKPLFYMYLLTASLIIIFTLCFHLSIGISLASILPASVIPLLIIQVYVLMNKKLQKQQILEIYSDKIVITGIDEGLIMFKDIAFYKIVTIKIYLLHITLRNSEDIRIVDGLNGGLEPFIDAFKEKINYLNSEENLGITEKSQLWG